MKEIKIARGAFFFEFLITLLNEQVASKPKQQNRASGSATGIPLQIKLGAEIFITLK